MKKFLLLGLVAVLTACPVYRLPEITIPNELSVAEQDAFLALINGKRQNAVTTAVACLASGPSFPAKTFNTNSRVLLRDTALTTAALAHLNYLVKNHPEGFTQPGNPNALAFDPHNGAGDGTPINRAGAAGFSGTAWGEVMAFDFPNQTEVLNRWLTSSFGHCQVAMDDDFNRAGFAKVTVASSSKSYWIMAVGRTP